MASRFAEEIIKRLLTNATFKTSPIQVITCNKIVKLELNGRSKLKNLTIFVSTKMHLFIVNSFHRVL